MSSNVLVLGGNGFIGRHAVAALRAANAHVVVGTRGRGVIDSTQRVFHLEAMTHQEDWRETVADFDVVLNCVGILRQVGAATYDRIHHLAPAAIAAACGATGTRFIQVSALGLSDADRSRFLTSKRRGEQAISTTSCDWIIVRPSLLDGEGGFGAAWLRGVSKLPLFVTPADARGRIAAVMATDIGEALARLCLGSTQALKLDQSRYFELGGPQEYDFASYIRGLRTRYRKSRSIAVPIPGIVARLGAHLCDLLHFTPFSFGHWELLRKDNVPVPNRLPELLGRPPQVVVESGQFADGKLSNRDTTP